MKLRLTWYYTGFVVITALGEEKEVTDKR